MATDAQSSCAALPRFQVSVCDLVGTDLTQIYNNGYRIICGAKHPTALGRERARDCWSEMWDIIYPMIKGVLDTGNAVWIEESVFCAVRKGFLEECYFTFSFSPIQDESGVPAGIFETVAEVTHQVLAQRLGSSS